MGNNIDIRDEPAKSIFLDALEIASPEARRPTSTAGAGR